MFDRSPECCAKNIWDWSSGNLQCSVTGPQELVCTDGAQLLPQHVTNLEPKQNQQSTHITHRKLFIKLDPGGIHTSYLSRARGENLVMWRNLSTWQMVRWSNSPHDRLSCRKNSRHEKCEDNLWKMWRNNVYNVWCFVAFYIILLQNLFFVIYAVLSRNMFPCDSRAFAWRKI